MTKDPEYYRDYWRNVRGKKLRRTAMQKLTPQQEKFKRGLEQGLTLDESVKRAYPSVKGQRQKATEKLRDLSKNTLLAITMEKYLEVLATKGIKPKLFADKYRKIIDKTSKKSTPHVDRNTLLAMESIEKIAGLRVDKREIKGAIAIWQITSDEKELMKMLLMEEEKRSADSES